jgi:DNA-binding transcriptional regulator LsrR (DeoR family)
MIAHHWKNWITSSELSEQLNLSKRRVNQILKFYLGLGIIEMNIMTKYPDDALRSKIFTQSTYAAPIYKCKYESGFETNDKET